MKGRGEGKNPSSLNPLEVTLARGRGACNNGKISFFPPLWVKYLFSIVYPQTMNVSL